MPRRQQRKGARIHDPQALHALHARLAVQHDHGIIRGAHLTSAGGVPHGLQGALDHGEELGVGLVGGAGEEFGIGDRGKGGGGEDLADW